MQLKYFSSGNGGDDDRMKLTYRQTGLRMVPNAMFVVNDRLFAICRNQIWIASVSAPRLYFSFYSKLKSQDRIQDFLLGNVSELPRGQVYPTY